MTYLALRFSGYVNGVAMRHGEVSRGMFPSYEISAITNGMPPLGLQPHLVSCSIPTSQDGAPTTIICAMRSAFPCPQSGKRMLRPSPSCSKPLDSHSACNSIPNSSPSVSRAGPAPISGQIFFFRIQSGCEKLPAKSGPYNWYTGAKLIPTMRAAKISFGAWWAVPPDFGRDPHGLRSELRHALGQADHLRR